MPTAASFSFPKARRLTRASEYERVKTAGFARRGKLLIVSVAPVEDCGPSRAGFATSRVLGSAVARNRVRRRLREIVRQHQQKLRPGFWMVVIARSDAVRATYDELKGEWLHL